MCDQWQDTWSVPVWGLAVEDPSGTFSSVPRQCQRKSDCLQVIIQHVSSTGIYCISSKAVCSFTVFSCFSVRRV